MSQTLETIIFDDKDVEEAYKLSIKRLVNRDYTRFELSTYLKEKLDVTDDQINDVLSLLEKQRYIDDERYMEEKASYLRNQLRGNGRIVSDLVKRGIKEEVVLNYLAQEDHSDYIERAQIRAEKYFRRNSSGSKRQRQNKCKAHLLQQGYEFGVIDEVLSKDLDSISKDEEKNSLRKQILQSKRRYSRQYEGYDLEQRIIQNALSKGYPYGSIKEILEELNEHED